MDEIYIKIRGQWKYLYRAVDTSGQTIDFLLTAKREAAAALRFSVRLFATMVSLKWSSSIVAAFYGANGNGDLAV